MIASALTVPNAITATRLASLPILFRIAADEHYFTAFVMFVIVGVSDAFDGAIARRWNQKSVLGAWLDPIADKIMIAGSYVALAVLGHIPVWLVILVLMRDVLIAVAALALRLRDARFRIAPRMIGKTCGGTQMFFAGSVLAYLAKETYSDISPLHLMAALADLCYAVGPWIVAAITIASAADYLAQIPRMLRSRSASEKT